MIYAFLLGLVVYPVIGMIVFVYFDRQDPSQRELNLKTGFLWVLMPWFMLRIAIKRLRP